MITSEWNWQNSRKWGSWIKKKELILLPLGEPHSNYTEHTHEVPKCVCVWYKGSEVKWYYTQHLGCWSTFWTLLLFCFVDKCQTFRTPLKFSVVVEFLGFIMRVDGIYSASNKEWGTMPATHHNYNSYTGQGSYQSSFRSRFLVSFSLTLEYFFKILKVLKFKQVFDS